MLFQQFLKAGDLLILAKERVKCYLTKFRPGQQRSASYCC